jgi:hypothetical protein
MKQSEETLDTTIKKIFLGSIIGALVTSAVGGGYWFVSDHFTVLTLVRAQDDYVKKEVLEQTLLRIDGRLSRIERKLDILE